MQKISSVSDIRRMLDASGKKIVGLGLTAFSRVTPALVASAFEVVCYKWGSDLEALERFCPIRAVQRDFVPVELEKLNTQSLLRHEGVAAYLRALGAPAIFSYKVTEWVERFCLNEGWTVLGNRRALRDGFEDKRAFFKLVERLGLPRIPGEQWRLDEITGEVYHALVRRVGRQLVFQLVGFSSGGGKGTYVVEDLDGFRAFLFDANERLEPEASRLVNVVKFIEGVSASITGCVTRHGVLTGVVQTQVMDVPELVWTSGRRGIWRGHDWSFREYPSLVQKEAQRIARSIGEEMADQGYKGMFGVDLMIDEEGSVYPNEVNPRYTGNFPVYSFLQYRLGEIPFDAFQLLEFLDLSYAMDYEALDRQLKQPKQGAFVNLHSQEEERWVQVLGDLPAGVYRLKSQKSTPMGGQIKVPPGRARGKSQKFSLDRVREGVTPLDIKEPDEFVVTDGVPQQGDLVKPHLRCGKIIFGRSILDGTHNRLNEWARTVIKLVCDRLDLQPVMANTH